MQVFDHSANEEVKVGGIENDVGRDFLIIRLGAKYKTIKLKKGHRYTLSMSFVAQLTDELRGLYRSSYKEDGVTRYYSSSINQRRYATAFLLYFVQIFGRFSDATDGCPASLSVFRRTQHESFVLC